MKTSEWIKARKRLVKEFSDRGITTCELCGGTFALSFHHIDKRSSGKAKNTFDGVRLLCAQCHADVEYDPKAKGRLSKLRR